MSVDSARADAEQPHEGESLRIGRNLRRAREAVGLTQEEAASRLGIKRQETISDHERGRHAPRERMLERYAELYGVTVARLRYAEGADDALIDRPEPFAPRARSQAIPVRAYEAAVDYLRRLERAGVGRDELEEYEGVLLSERLAKSHHNRYGSPWTEEDWLIHIDELWTVIREALARRGIVP